MRLTDFYIRHFRELREEHLAVADLRVLIGRNGAGKSSILDAIESVAPGGAFGDPALSVVWMEPVPTSEAGVFCIYELDDDLSEGPFISGPEIDPDSERKRRRERAVRSSDVFEILCSLLGPASFDTFMRRWDDIPEAPRGQWIDTDCLESEFERAKLLFGCADLQAFEHLVRTNSDYLQLADELPERFDRLMENAPYRREPGEGLGTLVHEAAGPLLELALSTPRIAWAAGYAGVAISREAISSELKEGFSKILNTPQAQGGFYANLRDESEGFGIEDPYFRDNVLKFTSGPCRGFSSRSLSPVIEAALQWNEGAPFILVRLTPDVGDRLPWDDRLSEGVYPIGPAELADIDFEDLLDRLDDPEFREKTTERRRRESERPIGEVMKRQFTSRPPQIPRHREGYGRVVHDELLPGPPPLSVVAAYGETSALTAEVERWLPGLSDHLWGSTASVINRHLRGDTFSQVRLLQSNLVLDENRSDADGHGRGTETNPLRIFNQASGTFEGEKWLIASTWNALGKEVSWQIRPAIKVASAVLAHRANEILPAFALARGEIAIEVIEDPKHWEQDRHIRITQGERELATLPAGIARWVSIALRLAGRRLSESSIWLPACWGDDVEQRASLLSELFDVDPEEQTATRFRFQRRGFQMQDEALGIALAAHDVLAGVNSNSHLRPDGGLVFEIDDSDHCQTVLLVDEPEVHLHLDAQTEVRNWLAERSSEWDDLSTVVATHSPKFFDYRRDEARISIVDPWDEQGPAILDITGNLPATLDERGDSLGMQTMDRFLLNKGFLLVEGPHDEQVIGHFYGEQLRSRDVRIVPLWGTKGEFSLTWARMLDQVERPMALLVDNRLNSVESLELERFKNLSRGSQVLLYGDGHLEIDVIFTLPEEAVRRRLADLGCEGNFEGGWAKIQERIRPMRRDNGKYLNGTEKKQAAAEMLGVPGEYGLGPGNFITPVIEKCEPGDRPATSLEDAMNWILAFFDSTRTDR